MRRLAIRVVAAGVMAVCFCFPSDIPKATAAPTVGPSVSSISYTDIGDSVQILGRFGLPLGRYLTLEGRRIGTDKVPRKMGAGNFLVEKVNGKATSQPCTVWVNRMTTLPAGTRCVLTGYETGEMVGIPPDVQTHIGGPMMQAVWHFSVRLVVLKVTAGPPPQAARSPIGYASVH